jgi:CBS domain-containing protein
MNRAPVTCAPSDSLQKVASLMDENEVGMVIVADENDLLCGVITDRDVCMAAYVHNERLKRITASTAVSEKTYSLRGDDDLATAQQMMREHLIRRIPIVDADDRVIGVLSIDDLARAATHDVNEVDQKGILEVMSATATPRSASLEMST